MMLISAMAPVEREIEAEERRTCLLESDPSDRARSEAVGQLKPAWNPILETMLFC